MERRKKGSGQITYVDEPSRKSKWKATVLDSRGKQKTRYFKTEKEAKAFLREVNADANKLKALMESGVTFAAFSQVFLEEKKKSNLKVMAYETLRQNVERVNGYLGKVMLRDIDSDMVQQMIFDLAKEGYSESIMGKSKIAVNSILKMAASKHFLEMVPVLDITIPTQKKQDTEKLAKNNWLKDAEIAAYEAECRRTYTPQKYTKYCGQELMVHPAGYKLLFILHTGLRLGEALALTWADYDEYSKTVIIDKNVVQTKDGKVTQTPKTEAGERVIVLNRQAVDDLRLLRKQFEEQTGLIEQRKKEALRQAELQYSGTEQKIAKQKVREQYAAIEREHKYICGSSTFPYGSSGHSSIRTTMEIYAHLDMTQNRYIPRSIDDLKEF